MKKRSVALKGLRYGITGVLLSVILFSCKEIKNEVPGESCADSKADTTAFTKELNGTDHVITLERALELTDNYARNKESILSGAFGNDNSILPDYETFNLQSIDSLVCQEATVGFRIYLGMDTVSKKIRLVVAGVDANGIDILQETRRDKQRGALRKQGGMTTTASAPPPPDQAQNSLLLDNGQRHP